MRIDGTFGYEAHGVAGKNGPANQPPAGQRAGKGPRAVRPEAGVEVAVSAHRAYIDKALAAAEVDAAAVAEARRLLDEGLLDTPEAVERLADAIVNRGL